jgi:hypothetical protein
LQGDAGEPQPFSQGLCRISQPSRLTGASFAAWVPQGDTGATIAWEITDTPFFGFSYDSGTASLAGTFIETNKTYPGWDAYTESFSIPNLALPAGMYWLVLHDGGTAPGSFPMYWDQNDGPSSASQMKYDLYYSTYTTKSVRSETFSIQGTTVPEPSEFLLLCVALGALGLLAWRRGN